METFYAKEHLSNCMFPLFILLTKVDRPLGARVLLLSRDASKLRDVPAAVGTTSVDYINETQVANVLKEHAVDAVVISLGLGGHDHDSEYGISIV